MMFQRYTYTSLLTSRKIKLGRRAILVEYLSTGFTRTSGRLSGVPWKQVLLDFTPSLYALTVYRMRRGESTSAKNAVRRNLRLAYLRRLSSRCRL